MSIYFEEVFLEETLRTLRVNRKMADYIGEKELADLLNLSIEYLEKRDIEPPIPQPMPRTASSHQ